MKKQSILLINRVYPPDFGATGQMAYDFVQHLAQQGHLVTVLTTGKAPHMNAQPNIVLKRIKGVRNHRKFLGFMSIWTRLFWASLRLKKHDIVITMTDPPMLVLVGQLHKIFKKNRHIHWSHDVYPDLFSELGVRIPKHVQSALLRLSRRAMKNSEATVPVSQCMARYLSKTGLPQDKMTVIPNWSPAEVVKLRSVAANQTYNQIEQPEKVIRDDTPKFRVLYAGHIGRAHVINPVLEAAEKLKEQSEIEFTFVCQKHIHEKLSVERNRRDISNIKLVPLQPAENITAIIESGDLHIVTMRKNVEGMLLPSKFYSSLMVSRPVIFVGPDNNDIADTIKKYEMGVVIPPHKIDELARAIYEYRMDGDRWLKAQEGAIKAAHHFNFADSMNKWDNLLRKVG